MGDGGAAKQFTHVAFQRLAAWLPGLCLALMAAILSQFAAEWLGVKLLGYKKSPVSAVSIAILLGLLIRNTASVPAICDPGLKFCLHNVLRFGIVFLGLRLSIGEVGKIAGFGLPIIVICIAVALVVVTWINRAMGLPKRLGSLIAVGTSICGVSAIAATAPIIEAEENEVSYAVACVTLFGLLALFLYPFFATAAFADNPKLAGVFLGTAIHDTAQVFGAGKSTEDLYLSAGTANAEDALAAASVTKLVRNTCMAIVIPLIAFLYHRSMSQGKGAKGQGWLQFLPLFVVLFVLMAGIRSLGDLKPDRPFDVLTSGQWKAVQEFADQISGWCLTMAMAAVGLGTQLNKLKNLGLRPFMVGLAAALLVGGVSFGLLQLTTLLGYAS